MYQNSKGCSVNGTQTLVYFWWNGLIWFFSLKTCIDAKSIMIQFAVTVYIRLWAAACKLIFYHFVQLQMECGLQSQGRHIFFISLFYRKVQITLILFFFIFSTKAFFRILFSSTSRAHPSQEGLGWTYSSCSGVSIIPGIPIKRETCWDTKVSQRLR